MSIISQMIQNKENNSDGIMQSDDDGKAKMQPNGASSNTTTEAMNVKDELPQPQ